MPERRESNAKDTVQPIGWYDNDKFEYLLIKTDKTCPLIMQPPVEIAFKKYLKENGYEYDFVWSTKAYTVYYMYL